MQAAIGLASLVTHAFFAPGAAEPAVVVEEGLDTLGGAGTVWLRVTRLDDAARGRRLVLRDGFGDPAVVLRLDALEGPRVVGGPRDSLLLVMARASSVEIWVAESVFGENGFAFVDLEGLVERRPDPPRRQRDERWIGELGEHGPLVGGLAALIVLLLAWWRIRRAIPKPIPGACKSCGAGYLVHRLAPAARDGAQACVRCPTCGTWYAVSTTGRHVTKVDERYVVSRWPGAVSARA